jgi:hypothetical protein
MKGERTVNPIVQKVIAAVVRFVLASAFGWLLKRGVELSEADLATFMTIAVPAIVGGVPFVWSIWEKFHARRKLVTALATPHTASENDIEEMIKNPEISTPPVSLKRDRKPRAVAVKPLPPLPDPTKPAA